MQRSALCRSRRELSNEYLLAKFGFDTAENEPCEVHKFKFWNLKVRSSSSLKSLFATQVYTLCWCDSYRYPCDAAGHFTNRIGVLEIQGPFSLQGAWGFDNDLPEERRGFFGTRGKPLLLGNVSGVSVADGDRVMVFFYVFSNSYYKLWLIVGKFWAARSRLHRSRILQVNRCK